MVLWAVIIIVIVNPIQVIFFAILILVIQQFDGLFLGPKILGESTGLKPLWVIFAIVVGGALFGVLGMFLGVPVMAVICYITNLVVEHFPQNVISVSSLTTHPMKCRIKKLWLLTLICTFITDFFSITSTYILSQQPFIILYISSHDLLKRTILRFNLLW